MKIYKVICFAAYITFLAACGHKTESKTEETAVEEQHEETNIVSLSDEQMKIAGIAIGNIEMKNLTTSISVNGTLAVPNQNKALVTSLVGGVLRTLIVHPGDYVRKGQLIGTIANTELSGMQQQMISINAQLKYTEQEQIRQKELVDGNAAPFKNLQKVESEISSLKAQQKALQNQLSTLGISSSGSISSILTITAPISGTISEVSAQIGSNIDASKPIAQIINNSELHLDLFVYEKDLPKVAPGQTIHFTLTNNPGKEYDATIYSIGTAFANESKSIPIHARVINNKAGLIEGMSVTARISLGEKVYPAIPDEAIVSYAGKEYIFILLDTNSEKKVQGIDNEKSSKTERETVFKRVQVIKGASDIGYTEIQFLNKLPQDTKVVLKGAFFLMAKMTNVEED